MSGFLCCVYKDVRVAGNFHKGSVSGDLAFQCKTRPRACYKLWCHPMSLSEQALICLCIANTQFPLRHLRPPHLQQEVYILKWGLLIWIRWKRTNCHHVTSPPLGFCCCRFSLPLPFAWESISCKLGHENQKLDPKSKDKNMNCLLVTVSARVKFGLTSFPVDWVSVQGM